jgi:Flp pilus assembly CpaF family ATPase
VGQDHLELNDDQAAALAVIWAILLDDDMNAFILRGSTGSRKTTLVASVCDVAEELQLT